MGKLGDALRAKFRTPQEAIQALGLDADLLASVVGDSNQTITDQKDSKMAKAKLTRQAGVAICALAGFLRPRLAQDANINLLPIVGNPTAKQFHATKRAIARDVMRACKGKFALDTSLGEVAEFLDMLDAHGKDLQGGEEVDEMPKVLEKPVKDLGEKFAEPDVMDADPQDKLIAFLKAKLRPEDLAQAVQMLGGGEEEGEEEEDPGEDAEPEGEGKLEELGAADEDEENMDGEDEGEPEQQHRDNEQEWRRRGEATDRRGRAHDSRRGRANDRRIAARGRAHDRKVMTQADMEAAIHAAKESVRQTEREISEARSFVRPWVGDLSMSFDAAPDVFRAALKMLGVKGIDKLHPDALRPILETKPKPGDRRNAMRERQAADSATSGARGFFERFADAERIGLQ